MKNDSMLGEFDRWSGFKRLITKWDGLLPALLFSASGMLVLFLGHLANSNALLLQILVSFTAESPQAPPFALSPVEHVFGYLGEPGHGLHVLLVGPLFIWLSIKFLALASRAFASLEASKQLVDDRGKSPTDVIACWSKKYFFFVFFALLAVFPVKNLVLEIPGALRAVNGSLGEWDFGYVQSPGLLSWVENSNSLGDGSLWELMKRNDVRFLGEIKEKIHVSLSERLPLNDARADSWMPYLKISNISSMDGEERKIYLKGGRFEVNLDEMLAQKKIHLKFASKGGPQIDDWFEMSSFWSFLCLGLILEGIFQGFAAYILLKVIFFVVLLYLVLPGGRSCRLRLNLVLNDGTHRYGLYPLHAAYNALAIIIALTGFYFALMILNKTGDDGAQLNSSAGQLLAFSGVFLAAACVGLGPMLLFHLKLAPLRSEKIRQLGESLAEASDAEKPDILDQIEVVQNQNTWPKNDKKFIGSIFAIVAFLAIPCAGILSKLPSDVQIYMNLATQTEAFADHLCRKIYLSDR